MSIPLEKWLVMALLTVISIFLGMIPYMMVRRRKYLFISSNSSTYKVILTILSCFGAGVLFSTSMLHLLPEVRESFAEIPSVWTTLDGHFPLAEVVVMCGFCLIYIVEEVAHFIMVDGHHGHHHHINTVARHNSIAHGVPIPNVKGASTSSLRGSIVNHLPANPSICITVPDEEDGKKEFTQSKEVDQRNKMCSITESAGTSMEEQCPDDNSNFTTSLRTFLALVALSFHAIMEGVAIGLQDSANVWVMFGAIASHKFVISFCMGMELIASQTKLRTYLFSIIFFAVISPVGIIIGSVLASDDSTQSVPVTVIEGLACGTLLYVVFFEILNRERERKSYSMSNARAIGFIQFIALVVGLVGMGCLLTLTHGHGSEASNHEHEDHDHNSN